MSEKPKIDKLYIYLKKLEKKSEQINTSRKKQVIKAGTEIYKIRKQKLKQS